MKNVYVIYFGSDCEKKIVGERILNIGESYTVSPSIYLVSCGQDAKTVYELLADNDHKEEEIVVLKLSNEEKSYWGFSEKNLWEWLRKNKTQDDEK